MIWTYFFFFSVTSLYLYTHMTYVTLYAYNNHAFNSMQYTSFTPYESQILLEQKDKQHPIVSFRYDERPSFSVLE